MTVARRAQEPSPPQPASQPEPPPPAPRVRGESRHDRVTSMLMSVIVGAMIVFGWLTIIAATTSAYAKKVTAPIEVIEVEGGGGGSPDGTVGGIETVDVAGAAATDQNRASNNTEEAGDFEEPSVEASPAAMLDSVAEAGQGLAEVDIGSVMPTGGKIATGRRQSKIGNGQAGFGYGPGDGGVRREDRWSIVYKEGQTADEYARQLDALGVELAIVSGNQLIYLSNFSNSTPTRRVGTGAEDKRLYFVWRGQGRKASDITLIQKAGLEVGEGVIFQFYPPAVEQVLSQLEVRYKGRQPGEIRNTRFSVVPTGNGYGFEVLSQEPLR